MKLFTKVHKTYIWHYFSIAFIYFYFKEMSPSGSQYYILCFSLTGCIFKNNPSDVFPLCILWIRPYKKS